MNREELLKIARPILFNTEMVMAILDERKTETRRILKGFIPNDAVFGYTAFTPKGCISCRGTFSDEYGEKFFKLPYKKGDILYVRETWNEWTDGYVYKAWSSPFPQPGECQRSMMIWRPSIHMPKEAARIFLKVTDVRVEHIKGMDLTDFLKEGVTLLSEDFKDLENAYWKARSKFRGIWNNTIKKADFDLYKFDANPFVWAIEFEYFRDV